MKISDNMNILSCIKVVEDWLDEESNEFVWSAWQKIKKNCLQSTIDSANEMYKEGIKTGEANIRQLL